MSSEREFFCFYCQFCCQPSTKNAPSRFFPGLRRSWVPKGGLEPPCPFEHNALNVACLPISPLRLEAYDTLSFEVCQYLSRMVIHYCRDACYNYSDFLNILESGSFYACSTEMRVRKVAGA